MSAQNPPAFWRSRRVREMVLLAIGVTTPIGILVVNGAAFVMAHLSEFRLTLAACALVSSLILNGLTAWWLLGLAGKHAGDLFAEYRRWVIAIAVLVVLVTSAGAAYFTYQGMRDPRRLPDAGVVLGTLLFLAIPFILSYLGRRMAGLRGMPAPIDDARGAGRPVRPPATPEPPAPSHRRIRG